MFIDRKMNKQIEVYLYSGKLLNDKNEKWNILLDLIDIVLSQIDIKNMYSMILAEVKFTLGNIILGR